ncbi:hypothetical protein C0583_06350 [Candidatus Parcubacteria bacterium]|nr:MAG: hypothetical protein C0583_06350 [Candidatus Parcubacteria bacterium]
MFNLYRLPNKIKNEEIVRIIRRDFFVLFLKILFFMFLCIIPFGFFAVMLISYPEMFSSPTYLAIIILSTSAYYLFVWLFFFFSFIDYYLDVWIITSERIIDIQQKGFFSRIISEQKLFRIQDVTSEVQGFIPTMFKYGNVYVQTAGTKSRFFFHQVPNPDEVRDVIIKLVRLNQKKHKKEMDKSEQIAVEKDFKESEEIQEIMKH